MEQEQLPSGIIMNLVSGQSAIKATLDETMRRVDEHFQGVNLRLDTLNGKVARHELEIGEQKVSAVQCQLRAAERHADTMKQLAEVTKSLEVTIANVAKSLETTTAQLKDVATTTAKNDEFINKSKGSWSARKNAIWSAAIAFATALTLKIPAVLQFFHAAITK